MSASSAYLKKRQLLNEINHFSTRISFSPHSSSIQRTLQAPNLHWRCQRDHSATCGFMWVISLTSSYSPAGPVH
jgi:hypothetical protein